MASTTFTLPDRVLVTGAAGGIGSALVARLASQGVEVHATDRSPAPAGSPAANWIDADLATQSGRRAAVDGVTGFASRSGAPANGYLGGLVHVAGIIDQTDWDTIEAPEIDHLMTVNLQAPFFLSRLLLDHFDAQASIVLLGSVSALRASPKTPFYSASKAALRNLGASMALAWQPRGIRVNVVAPGLIDTPLTDRLNVRLAGERGLDVEQIATERSQPIPMGRPGTPDEVASACLFLLSRESSYCNGITIHPAGGVMAGAV